MSQEIASVLVYILSSSELQKKPAIPGWSYHPRLKILSVKGPPQLAARTLIYAVLLSLLVLMVHHHLNEIRKVYAELFQVRDFWNPITVPASS